MYTQLYTYSETKQLLHHCWDLIITFSIPYNLFIACRALFLAGWSIRIRAPCPATCSCQGMAMVHWRGTLPSPGGVENAAQMPCSTVVFFFSAFLWWFQLVSPGESWVMCSQCSHPQRSVAIPCIALWLLNGTAYYEGWIPRENEHGGIVLWIDINDDCLIPKLGRWPWFRCEHPMIPYGLGGQSRHLHQRDHLSSFASICIYPQNHLLISSEHCSRTGGLGHIYCQIYYLLNIVNIYIYIYIYMYRQ